MNTQGFKIENWLIVYEDANYAILAQKDMEYGIHAADIAHIGLNMLFFGLKNKAPADRKVIIDGLIDKMLDLKNVKDDKAKV